MSEKIRFKIELDVVRNARDGKEPERLLRIIKELLDSYIGIDVYDRNDKQKMWFFDKSSNFETWYNSKEYDS